MNSDYHPLCSPCCRMTLCLLLSFPRVSTPGGVAACPSLLDCPADPDDEGVPQQRQVIRFGEVAGAAQDHQVICFRVQARVLVSCSEGGMPAPAVGPVVVGVEGAGIAAPKEKEAWLLTPVTC